MKANELRISNLIEYFMEDNHDERKAWWETYVVDAQTILQLQTFPEDKDYRAIKITVEWLIKLGFIKHPDRKYYVFKNDINSEFAHLRICDVFGKKEFNVSIGDDDNGIVFCTLKYIHQLQNLFFAVYGEELTLNK